jgi:putative redox protein
MIEIEKTRWAAARIGTDAYRTELTTDTHTLYADEPVDLGGKDTGPGPGDFLRLSLASCTAITLRMYANRKGFDVKAIEVKVNTEEDEGKTIFHSIVHIDGNLDADQRKRMLQIAKKCPIHKVLMNPIDIITTLSER